MTTSLADIGDVEDMWRPLTEAEKNRVGRLIIKASTLLRQRMPSVDDRIAAFIADPTDPTGLDAASVATVVATVVKRFLVNTDGLTSETKSLGSASITKSYTQRGAAASHQSDARGALAVLDSDLAALNAATPRRAFLGTATATGRLNPPRRPWIQTFPVWPY